LKLLGRAEGGEDLRELEMEMEGRGSRGQSVVELALLMPFLLWILAGAVDFGRVYYYDIVVINAARSGARAAADIRKSDAQVKSAVKVDAGTVPIADGDIAITVSPSGDRELGSTVTVKVTYRFTPIMPILGAIFPGGVLTASRSASMVAF
jgi:TadE-like protein